MALKLTDQMADEIDDEVGLCLRELIAIPTWTGDKHLLFAKLDRLVEGESYLRFRGDYRDYHLERKGQSCLFDIPENQRGALQKFRGQRIRLICAGRWDPYSGRLFYAKKFQLFAVSNKAIGDA